MRHIKQITLAIGMVAILTGCGAGIPALIDAAGTQLPPAQTISTRGTEDEPPIVNNGSGFVVQAPADWGPLPVTQRPLITFQGTSD